MILLKNISQHNSLKKKIPVAVDYERVVHIKRFPFTYEPESIRFDGEQSPKGQPQSLNQAFRRSNH